jgi:Na+(H+)/acetate symporter ActP
VSRIGDWLEALFSEQSKVSSTRVMSFISLLIGGYLAIHGLDVKSDLVGLATLVGVFVGAAFGGKVWQKKIEVEAAQKALPPPPPPSQD